MNPGSLTTVQLVGVEENIQTKEYIRVSSCCVCVYDSVLKLRFFYPLFIWSVSERVRLVVSLGQYISGNLWRLQTCVSSLVRRHARKYN